MREKGKFFETKKKKFAKRQSRGIKSKKKKRERIFNSLSFVVKDNEAL